VSTDKDLPNFWRFVWLLFMMPISLHERLKAVGIDPEANAIKLLRNDKTVYYRYFRHQFIFLCVLTPLILIFMGLFLQKIGLIVVWQKVAIGIIFGVVSGIVVGIALEIVAGTVIGILLVISVTVSLGVLGGVTQEPTLGTVVAFITIVFANGIIIGVTVGVLILIFMGVSRWVAIRSITAIVIFAVFTIIVVVIGVSLGIIEGFTITYFMAIATYIRLPFYLLELVQQSWLYVISSSKQRVQYSPIFYHELSFFPLPFLGPMIEQAAQVNVPLARRALEQCAKILGQKRIGEKTLVKLQLTELDQYFQQQRFLALYELNGEWLPSRAPDNPEVLRQISEIGNLLNAYQLSRVSTQQQQHLQQAKKQLDGLQNRLLKENSDWARFAPAILKHWQTWLANEIEKNEKIATREIPNPFYFSKPLNPDMGSEVFRGREVTVQQLERLLCDSRQSLSIVLLAPRRCGKSSLLKMLPQLLPQAIFVFYDLQDNPAEHIQGFFHSLITQVKTQAYVERSIKLPDIPSETNLSQSDAWFKQVDQQLTQPLLICIDEFERLPTLLPHANHVNNTNNDLLRLMGWFRATIQHRQNVRLLISGAAAFDELDRIWDDHFINLQTLKLPHLSADVCLDLLRQPTRDFPSAVIPQAVAEYIIERTQGQPYLTQALAGTGIEYINYRGLKQLELSLMDAVEQEVLERCGSYFRDVYHSAPNAAQQLFYRLSQGETIDLALDLSMENKAAVRWLKRRLLMTEAGEVNIPLFARWVRDWVEMD